MAQRVKLSVCLEVCGSVCLKSASELSLRSLSVLSPFIGMGICVLAFCGFAFGKRKHTFMSEHAV